jgi:hypothetical protein
MKTTVKNFSVAPVFGAAATQAGRGPALVLSALLILVWVSVMGEALGSDVTFAERLGWKANDVVVILHVDDVAFCFTPLCPPKSFHSSPVPAKRVARISRHSPIRA